MAGASWRRDWPAASSSAAAPPWRACRRRSTFGSTPPPYTRRAPLVSEQTRGVAALAVPTGSEARIQAHHLPTGATADRSSSASRTVAFTSLGPGSGEADADARPRRRAIGQRWRRARDRTMAGRRDPGHGADRQLRRRAARDPPQRAAHRSRGRGRLWRGRAGIAAGARRAWRRARAAAVAQARQPAAQAGDRHLSGPDRASAGRPARRSCSWRRSTRSASAGRASRWRSSLPAREFRHPLARAIIERAAQAGGDPPKPAARWRQRLAALGDTRGGTAAAGRGATGAASRQRAWR